MDYFIRVSATPCTSQGNTNPQALPRELDLNTDLICAFDRKEVLLKQGIILNIGGKHFTNLKKLDKR